jgi:hypothetical protein
VIVDESSNAGRIARVITPALVVLLVVCIVFLVIAFITLAHELERIRHVLYTQGRTIDSLNHVDAIQSRQLDMHRARLNDLTPLPADPFNDPPYAPSDQIKREQNGTGLAQENHHLRPECNHSPAISPELHGIAQESQGQPPDPRRGERTNGDGQVG